MFRALIIDDEKYIRKSILNRVNWEQFDIREISESENGMEALCLMESFRPHIVITDIRMPVMDGLTFIKEARRRFPGIRYIITSAYQDFDYAREAISLGVAEYVLKPVKVPEIENALRKIVHIMKEEQISRSLRGADPAGELPLKWKGSQTAAIAFMTDAEEEIGGQIDARLKEGLPEEGVTVYYLRRYSWEGCYVFLFNADSLDERLISLSVMTAWHALEGRAQTVAWSEVMPAGRMSDAVGQCIRILKRRIFYPGKKILTRQELSGHPDTETAGNCQTQIHDIIRAVCQQNMRHAPGTIRSELLRLPALIVDSGNTITEIEANISELLLVLRYVLGAGLDDTEMNVMFHSLTERDFLLRYRTADELQETLRSLISAVMDDIFEENKIDLITEIKNYIMNNYAEDLRASEIAAKFFVNASYLSAKFKEKTGTNMTAYIEGVRMEKATVLLQEKSRSITDVSMLTGYSDPNYFSKVFRKYTGLSPREYREEYYSLPSQQ